MIFLRIVPPEVMAGVASGAYKVTGSVVRNVATGQGVAFLQETGLMGSFLSNVLGVVMNPVAGLANLALSVVTVGQNEQIKARLAEVQSSLGLLQNLQIASLAVSGLGLGVSVVGFAVMLKRLKGIETHLSAIEAKIDAITSDRRSDGLRMILADVGTQLETVDTLSARSNKVTIAESAEQALATSAGRLESIFQHKTDAMQRSSISLTDMDMLWSLAAAIRLCHEAGSRALYSIDELEAASQLSQRRARRFLEISQPLAPDSLARLYAQRAESPTAFADARRLALPQAEALVQGLRDSVASVGSQSELAAQLIARKVSGPDYLKEVSEENRVPLLVLPE